MHSSPYHSPLGWIEIQANNDAVISLSFIEKRGAIKKDSLILKQCMKELDEYFAGTRKRFTIPIAPEGTPFQKRVWSALSHIPWGTTQSYEDIAHIIANPRGMRAVGNANGKNPIPIIIPCHRIIAKNGALGGYSAGLNHKKWLLEHEQVLLRRE